jgi:lambda family phage portal protein
MKLVETIKGLFGRGTMPLQAVRPRMVRGRYDAAQTTDDNSRHWLNADALSADAANSAGVRAILRKRCRYEAANNSYCRGMVDTLADYVVGNEIKIQIRGAVDKATAREIEYLWREWADETRLVERLRLARKAKAVDGEAFLMLTNNPRLSGPSRLQPTLLEAERISDPSFVTTSNNVDGVILDRHGNPTGYQVLKQHPGGDTLSAWGEWDTVSARYIRHWANLVRPEQHRGIPEIVAALPLFADLRRYTQAVIAAAETAADFAAVIQTRAPAGSQSLKGHPFETVELEKRMATVLPDGWELGQLKSEQPTTTYAAFKAEIINEIARCLGMPYNIAAGNSKDYNYASGRLDHQSFLRRIRIERGDMQRQIMAPIFREWLRELRLSRAGIDGRSFLESGVHVEWHFDGFEHVDPAKEATAQAKRLESRTTTLAREYGRDGLDWEEEMEQGIAEEARRIELRKKYKLPETTEESQP